MKKLALAAVIGTTVIASHAIAEESPSLDELWQVIQKQEKEIEALKQEQKETEAKVEATADAVESGSNSGGSKSSEWATKTKIGGYGEHHFNNFDGKDDKIDAHRFVLYIGHEFNEKVRFFSELELEHGLAGDGKPGEVELEQAYIEVDYAQNHSFVAGQFLIPVGILNETHEPDTFYGTERNLIEKNIIPTTWWETGGLLRGRFGSGFSYDVAVHSGLKTDAANIRSGRQKSAKATANDFAYTGRLKYTGVQGLELAATYQYQSNLSQGEIEGAAANLTEAHAIYTVAGFSIRALAATWNVDGEEAKVLGRDKQDGYYVEPSYKFNDKVGIFVRYSEWDNTAGFSASESAKVVDYGVNYWLLPNVVFKADMSKYQENTGTDSFNVGVGWSF